MRISQGVRFCLVCIALVIATAGRTARTQDADPWSPVVNGLQARLTLVRAEPLDGHRHFVVHIQIRNVMWLRGPVNLDGNRLRVGLLDAAGVSIQQVQEAAHSGPVATWAPIALPMRSVIDIDLSVGGWVVPRDAAMFVEARGQSFALRDNDRGRVFVQATLQGDPPPNNLPPVPWSETLVTPPVKVEWND